MTIAGTLAKTLDNATLSGTGSIPKTGVLSATLANAALSGTANVTSTVTGTGAATLENVVLSGSAAVTDAVTPPSGGYLAPQIFYPRPKKKVEENDEAITMALISLLDEAW